MPSSFLAYRLPFSKKNHFFKANAIPFQILKDIINEKGFVFHSFDGNENYFLKDLEELNPKHFEFFYRDEAIKETDFKTYQDFFHQAQNEFEKNSLKKVIASRIIVNKFSISPIDFFNKLNENYKNTFNYIISIKNVGTWIGCTPEKLLKTNKNVLNTVSLAGTKFNKNVLWGEKEMEEQKIVSDFIKQVLTNNECEKMKEKGPFTAKAGKLYHLKTTFDYQFNKNKLSQIISDLHPTPATCGLPKEKAKHFIKNNENHDRKFYTGFLGIVTKNAINLYVNLRCMELINNQAIIYVGGGITKDSILEKEWLETEKKSETLLNMIGG